MTQYLEDIEQWEEFKKKANGQEIIVLKFSTTCPISRGVEQSFDRWITKHEDAVTVAKVDVVRSRPLSQHLAKEFKVQHESPQVLWLDAEGKLKWSGSHHGISPQTLDAQIK